MEELNKNESPEVHGEATEVDALKAELADKQRALQELEHKILRIHADMDNMRKRLQREKEDIWTVAVADCLAQMLPVVDNFDRAVKVMPDTDWAQGVVMVNKQLQDILLRLGLEPVEATGQFNPLFHEAVMQDTHCNEPENTITAEFERGYTYKGKVLRPSKVRVSTGG